MSSDDRIRVLAGATAFGLYEDGLLGVLQERRFLKLRARQTIVATGATEHPMIFENNDLPGVMLGDAARRLQGLHAVTPGRAAVVVAADDRGVEVALDLRAAGVVVTAVVDARDGAESADIDALRAGGTTILRRSTVLAARGAGRVERAVVGDLDGRSVSEHSCDLVCLVGGTEPAAALVGHAGVKLRAEADGRLTPGPLPRDVLVAGEAAGLAGLDAILVSGRLAGARAARALAGPGRLDARVSELGEAMTSARGHAARPSVAIAPGRAAAGGGGTKRFVCLCEDVTEKDVRQAVAEGFDHIETLKRYTTVTMGPCQGKMCHRLSIELCAAVTGRTVEETGSTTARPRPSPCRSARSRRAPTIPSS